MGFSELMMTAVALSMDAFAVAICKGLATGKVRIKHMLITGAWFGGFQALMPLLGYLLGQTFNDLITPVDHWVTFFLLGVIGFNMLKESLECEEEQDASLGVKIMLTMALATSIDALAVGIGFALIPNINIILAVASIGVITFTLSALGVKIGSAFGSRWRAPAEFLGGLVLIAIGAKMLLEHTLSDKSIYDLAIGISASFLMAVALAVFAIATAKRSECRCSIKPLLYLYSAASAVLFAIGIVLTVLSFVFK